MDEYRYSKLSEPRQFRLLKLYAGSSPGGLEVSVDLIHTTLETAPAFDALSYAWGDPSPKVKIRCSGPTAEIGLNLHSALRHLKPRPPETERLIWADALCINQKSTDERGKQVRIMGDIYAKATDTLIWLGEEDESVSRAMTLLQRFEGVWETIYAPSDSAIDLQALYAKFSSTNSPEAERVLQKSFGGREGRAMAFRDIWMLLRRPWFTRKWVIQEVAKSRGHGMFFVTGSKVMPWSALRVWSTLLLGSAAVSELFMSSWPWEIERRGWLWWSTYRITCPTTSDLLSDSSRFRVFAFVRDDHGPLMCWFAQTLAFRCTDPRDHIISLLGISADYSNREDLVDYTISAEQLYRRLSHACLNNSRDLKILWSFVSIVPLNRRASNSWLTELDELLNTNGLATATMSIAQHDVKLVDACGNTELNASISGNRLQIKGRMVDRIDQLGMDISGFPEFENKSFRTDDTNRKLMTHLDCWFDECRAIADSANRDDDSFRSTILLESLFQSIMPDITTAKEGWWTYREIQKTLASALDPQLRSKVQERLMSNPSTARIEFVVMKMLYRRFGRTKSGRIGWAPQVAEEGDLICVFDGMEFPYVVRPIDDVEGVYALVGECYISDLMDGEALKIPGVESTIINLQ